MIKPDTLRTIGLDIADKLEELWQQRQQTDWAARAQRWLAKARDLGNQLSDRT